MVNLISVRECEKNIVNKKQSIANLWQCTGMLDNLEESNKLDISTILENARIENDNNSSNPLLQRLFLPINYRVYHDLISPQLVSVQPMVNNENTYFYFDDINEIQAEIKLKDFDLQEEKLKTIFPNIATNSFNHEKELSLNISDRICKETDFRIIQELFMKAGHQWEWDYRKAYGRTISEKIKSLEKFIKNAIKEIGEYNNRGEANWIVASSDIASILHRDMPTESFDIKYCGEIFNQVKLFDCFLLPMNVILLGYKGSNNYDSGFFYMPKLMISLGENNTVNRQFGKEWYKDGESFYGKITIKNFIF